MEDFESLAHVRWKGKHPIGFIPKYRKVAIFGSLRVSIGRILLKLCDPKGIGLLEGHTRNGPPHACSGIPLKCSVAYTIGFLKG